MIALNLIISQRSKDMDVINLVERAASQKNTKDTHIYLLNET